MRDDIPTERRMMFLVNKLERCCEETFEAERRRLEKMKRPEEESSNDEEDRRFEEGRKMEDYRNDSAVD